MTFNELVCKNIRQLLHIQNKQIGTLEKHIGLSLGYFSRVEKSDKHLPFDKMYHVSRFLNVTLEDLVNPNMIIEHEIKIKEQEIAEAKKFLKEAQETLTDLTEQVKVNSEMKLF